MDLGGLVALESVGEVVVKKAKGKSRHIHVDVSENNDPVGAIAEVSKYFLRENIVIEKMWYEKGTVGLIYQDYNGKSQ